MEDTSYARTSFNSTGLKKVLVNGRYTNQTEFNVEKPPGQYSYTDFGSKGLFKETTTGTNLRKSSSVFKDVANLRLAGKTFDATHLD